MMGRKFLTTRWSI